MASQGTININVESQPKKAVPPAAPPEGTSLRKGAPGPLLAAREAVVLFSKPHARWLWVLFRCRGGGFGFPSRRRPGGHHTGWAVSSRARCGVEVGWRSDEARLDTAHPARCAGIADATESHNPWWGACHRHTRDRRWSPHRIGRPPNPGVGRPPPPPRPRPPTPSSPNFARPGPCSPTAPPRTAVPDPGPRSRRACAAARRRGPGGPP